MTTIVDEPTQINLVAWRGDTWTKAFTFNTAGEPLDLTGITCTAQARATTGDVYDLTVTVTDPTSGTLQLSFPAGGVPADRYTYDVELDDAGAVTTWIQGWLRVKRDVTNELE